MNTMIALPIAAAVPTTAPAMPAQDFARDAELVSLAHRMIELLPAYRAAVAHESDRMDEFRSRMPQLGDVFRWKMTDPVSHTMERLPGRKCRLWCDLQDIERKRRIRPGTWHFVGTDEEHEAIKDDDFDETVPRPHIVHLYKKIPCKRQQNRLNKLVAALDEHTAAHDALRAELGISEAAKHAEALCQVDLGYHGPHRAAAGSHARRPPGEGCSLASLELGRSRSGGRPGRRATAHCRRRRRPAPAGSWRCREWSCCCG